MNMKSLESALRDILQNKETLVSLFENIGVPKKDEEIEYSIDCLSSQMQENLERKRILENAKRKRLYANNLYYRERVLNRNAKWKFENYERYLEIKRNSYHRHKEEPEMKDKIAQRNHDYYQAHKEEIKQKRKEYRAQNHEKVLESNRKYREKVKEKEALKMAQANI